MDRSTMRRLLRISPRLAGTYVVPVIAEGRELGQLVLILRAASLLAVLFVLRATTPAELV